MWQAGPQRARPPSLVEDRVCSSPRRGWVRNRLLGALKTDFLPCHTAGHSADGGSAAAAGTGQTLSYMAQAPRSTTRQYLKGAQPPAPQSHPWAFVPQLRLHLAGGPF